MDILLKIFKNKGKMLEFPQYMIFVFGFFFFENGTQYLIFEF